MELKVKLKFKFIDPVIIPPAQLSSAGGPTKLFQIPR